MSKPQKPFGQRPSKGSFGKKPSKGNFGKKKSVKKVNRFRELVPNKKQQQETEEYIKDMEYLQWLQEQHYGCFVCGEQGKIEWHHVKRDSTDKKNHKRLIPLCGEEHHRLGELSPHGGPVLFRKTFRIEFQNDYADSIYQAYLEATNADHI